MTYLSAEALAKEESQPYRSPALAPSSVGVAIHRDLVRAAAPSRRGGTLKRALLGAGSEHR